MSNDQGNPPSNDPSLRAPEAADVADTEGHLARFIDEQGDPDAADAEGHRRI